jgi:hypothetical protein
MRHLHPGNGEVGDNRAARARDPLVEDALRFSARMRREGEAKLAQATETLRQFAPQATARGYTQQEIARLAGVTDRAVRLIVNRR